MVGGRAERPGIFEIGGMTMSSGSTETLGLHLWEKTDLFKMDEFNEDNQLLDAAAAARPWVRLDSQTLSEEASAVTLDLSGLDLTAYSQLHLHIDGTLVGTGRYPLNLLLNGISGSGLYLSMSVSDGDSAFSLNEGDGLPLGCLAGSGSGTVSGMEAVISLYANGLMIETESITRYGELTPVFEHCLGLPSADCDVTPDTLESIRLFFEDDVTSFEAGSSVTVYGLLL